VGALYHDQPGEPRQIGRGNRIYKVEPYVVAADVYAVPPHTGRGGWTWYTGSAAWMYRLIVESLLGLELEVRQAALYPACPADWKGFKLHYRYRETVYHIEVLQTPAGNGEIYVRLDGIEQSDKTIPLVDDHKEHWIEVGIPSQHARVIAQDAAKTKLE
jgi:cyclic beta-1,2-glucan synthetase